MICRQLCAKLTLADCTGVVIKAAHKRMHSPATQLHLERTLGQPREPGTFFARICKIAQLSADVRELSFEVTAGDATFAAGQWVPFAKCICRIPGWIALFGFRLTFSRRE